MALPWNWERPPALALPEPPVLKVFYMHKLITFDMILQLMSQTQNSIDLHAKV
jgi:hypothetical protein